MKVVCTFKFMNTFYVCLLAILEKRRQCLDNGGVSRALFTDLSRAFDCVLHDLLLANLAAYVFNYNSLQMLQSYLSNRKHETKIKDSFNKYCENLSLFYYTREKPAGSCNRNF